MSEAFRILTAKNIIESDPEKGTRKRNWTPEDAEKGLIYVALRWARLKHFGILDENEGPMRIGARDQEMYLEQLTAELQQAASKLLESRTRWEEYGASHPPIEELWSEWEKDNEA